MVEERKPRTRRGKTKKAAGSSGRKQLSLRDMFGGGESSAENPPITDEPGLDTIDLANASGSEADGSSIEDIMTIELTAEKRTHRSPVPKKPLHPFFTRQAKAEAEQLLLQSSPPPAVEDEPIFIADEELPKRPPKPLHPFFLRTNEISDSDSLSSTLTDPDSDQEAPEGSSWEAPIVIESSPVRMFPKFSRQSKKPRTDNPQFARRPEAPPVPFPDKDSQHTLGFRATFPHPEIPFARRTRPTRVAQEVESVGEGSSHSMPWLAGTDLSPPSFSTSYTVASLFSLDSNDVSNYMDAIPKSHRDHPAISRLVQSTEMRYSECTPSMPQGLWIDRWRPSCAQEVLGNEEHAEYLKRWMVELKLYHEHRPVPMGSSSAQPKAAKKRKAAKPKGSGRSKAKGRKPNIVRHITKRRKLADELEDFVLADDDTDMEDETDELTAGSSDFDDFAFCQDMYERTGGASFHTTDDSCPSSPSLPPSVPPSLPPSQVSTPAENLSAYLPPVRARKLPQFGRNVCSTILLTGPPGCGKTAAVYACARELGWDVFEVYPGIGERSGADLKKLLGDIGKNHLVKLQGTPKKVKRPERDFFQPRPMRTRTRALRRVESQDELNLVVEVDVGIDVDNVALPHPSISLSESGDEINGDEEAVEPEVNQVVVLIEEVDVLYQTDTNFWSALINIIKECKRPVILTCNDVSRVPCRDLALQSTLFFTPCPTPLAVSYLQSLCLVEGVAARREDLTRLYNGSDEEDQLHRQDLRRAIMQLHCCLTKRCKEIQMTGRPATIVCTSSEDRCLGDAVPPVAVDPELPIASDQAQQQDIVHLLQMLRVWEAGSFIDSHLCRETHGHLRAVFDDELGPSPDDLLGYRVLYAQANTDKCPISALYHGDEDMRAHALALMEHGAPRGCSANPHTSTLSRSLDAACLQHHEQVSPILRQPISGQGPSPWRTSVSREALYLDYAPWIRYMVAVDDAMELASLSLPGTQSRRSTRNSMRTGQDRWLKMDLGERRTLSQTSLRLDEELITRPSMAAPTT